MKTVPIPADGIKRVIIKYVNPVVANGAYAAKATEHTPVHFSARIIADGHDKIYSQVVYRAAGSKNWQTLPLQADHNDRWHATWIPEQTGIIEFKVQAWISDLASWKDAFDKKAAAGAELSLDSAKGIEVLALLKTQAAKNIQKSLSQLLEQYPTTISPADIPEGLYEELLSIADKNRITSSQTFTIDVERTKAGFSTWYELFPRSTSTEANTHGTFRDVARELPRLAAAGFDVLYLPPVHPIGKLKRKGKNNSLTATDDDPGSPWAIGSDEGGHKALHPQLGSLDDFKFLVKEAKKNGIEVAMDIAFQCAPDHPYVKEHPEWFKWRADGTVQFAENPPKKYEDILPFDFESKDWESLWQELLSIFTYWIGNGVKIFRVDNPHTKSLRLWEWIISSVRKQNPEVIFLAEAFTRPYIMEQLAMAGFTQSYTYFTWRNSKAELQEYLQQLTQTEMQHFFRPNFWPNTPDILPEHLVSGGENMHIIRVLLAATLSSNYGLYGPVYERGINQPMPGKEEYIDNEKYEIKHWEPQPESRTWQTITAVNKIRRNFAALQSTNNIRFLTTSGDQVMAYIKYDELRRRHLLIVINLDPVNVQSAWINIPKDELNQEYGAPLQLQDELNDERYEWNNDWNYVELDPNHKPAHIFSFINTK